MYLGVNGCWTYHMVLQGTDIPDVDDVVQFMTPEALSVWIQRAGCAGRDGRPSRAILLIELLVGKKLKSKKFSKNTKGSSGSVSTMEKSIANQLSLW